MERRIMITAIGDGVECILSEIWKDSLGSASCPRLRRTTGNYLTSYISGM